MNAFYFAILALLFLVILFFTVVLKIVFTLDTKKENVKLVLLWLYPFMKITAEGNASTPQLSVYLFKKKVYSAQLNTGKAGGKSADFIKAVSPSDIQMYIDYGFRDPFVTGLAYGSISAASELANFVEIRQHPDFISDEDYVCLNATACVNVGNTIVNYLKAKAKKK